VAQGNDVRIVGLNQLRADLRRAVGAYPKQLTVALKRAGVPIVRKASNAVPRRSGRLAASIKPSVRGTTGPIVSPVPYAGGAEWGARGKWAGWVRAHGSPPRFVWPAVEDSVDEMEKALADELDEIFRAYGWFH
jgi:hypothetical protein